jgi:zinc transport system substrate-binding protein
MKNAKKTLLFLLVFAVLSVHSYAAPNVLATIKPVHSLVSAVMAGVGTPQLLIGGANSVHSYAMKPSDADKIARAELIFEIGPDLETYLQAPLKNLSHGKTVVLEYAPGVIRLPARHGGLWEEDADRDHGHGPADPHLWLDPHNATAMTRAIAAALAAADPANAKRYRDNAARVVADIDRLDGELAATLAPVRGRPYLVFHDAYQYFERRYALHPAGAVTVAPDRSVGPGRLVALRRIIDARQARCLFREPQFPPRLIDTLKGQTAIRIGVLDPLGADRTPGPALYGDVLRALAQSLAQCLK